MKCIFIYFHIYHILRDVHLGCLTITESDVCLHAQKPFRSDHHVSEATYLINLDLNLSRKVCQYARQWRESAPPPRQGPRPLLAKAPLRRRSHSPPPVVSK